MCCLFAFLSAIVEKNPTKFKVDAVELKARKTFIGDTRIFIQDVRVEMTSPTVKGKLERDRREDLTRSKQRAVQEEKFSALKREHEADNQRFLDQNNGQLLLEQQDARLDQTAAAVTRLKHVAIDINNEVESQNRMLDELDTGVENTSSRLKGAMQKMASIYKNSKGASYY